MSSPEGSGFSITLGARSLPDVVTLAGRVPACDAPLYRPGRSLRAVARQGCTKSLNSGLTVCSSSRNALDELAQTLSPDQKSTTVLPQEPKHGHAPDVHGVSRESLLRKQCQVAAMVGSHDREVATVERRDLRLVKLFAGRDHGGVDQAELERGVLALQFGSADERGLRKLMKAVRAACDVLDERLPGRMPVELEEPVVDFHQHRGRHDQVFGDLLDHRDAARVLRVRSVQ